MKLFIGEPGEWEISIETEPLPPDRFDALCGIVYTLIAAAVIIALFAMFRA